MDLSLKHLWCPILNAEQTFPVRENSLTSSSKMIDQPNNITQAKISVLHSFFPTVNPGNLSSGRLWPPVAQGVQSNTQDMHTGLTRCILSQHLEFLYYQLTHAFLWDGEVMKALRVEMLLLKKIKNKTGTVGCYQHNITFMLLGHYSYCQV